MDSLLQKEIICHFTSVHPATDRRIFEKECTSLANSGYEVYLIAPDAKNEVKNGVKIIGVPFTNKSRIYRMLYGTKIVYKKALEINADIYHFHDPELIPYGIKLKRKGKKVIFDSHEDVPSQILGKEWIPTPFRKLLSNLYSYYEQKKLKHFDVLISVTPLLTSRLKGINSNTFQVTNYPLLCENLYDSRKWGKSICFAGGISKQWMHDNVIKALDSTVGITYEIAGNKDESYFSELKKLQSWSRVNFIGKIPFNQVHTFISNSTVGIALNDYNANVGFKMGSLGNTKLFEYMQVGIPVICTDFILWKEIIGKYNCGICVNPHNIEEISEAINFIITNQAIARLMGDNGRKAIEDYYNWSTQEIELLSLYKSL